MAPQHPKAVARLHLPDAQRLVRAPGYQQLPIGMEGDGPDAVTVALQHAYTHPFVSVPQPNRPVVAATGQQGAVGAEGNGAHAAAMVLQHAKTLTRTLVGDIP